MPGKKKGGNDDFKFELGGSGKPVLDKETQAALMPFLQKKLDGLVGKDSGYLETLPQSVQMRIKALKKIQEKHDSFQKDFEKEVSELEKKYDALKNPLYTRRAEIVKGVSEPTAEELAGDDKEEKKEAKEGKTEDNVKGVPEFWLQAIKHNFDLEPMIQPVDEPVLKHLEDVSITYPEADNNETFSIEFHFSDNEYFENKVLSKTFFVIDGMFQRVETSGIKWKSGKNVTVKMEAQKQGGRGRGGRRGRGGKGGAGGPQKMVEVPVDSFFHFFDEMDSDGNEEDEDEQDRLEQEFDIGMSFRSLTDMAVNWFTGEVEMEDMDEDDEGDDEGDDDDDDELAPPTKPQGKKKTATKTAGGDDDDSEDDEEYDPKTDPKAQAQPECKQQ